MIAFGISIATVSTELTQYLTLSHYYFLDIMSESGLGVFKAIEDLIKKIQNFCDDKDLLDTMDTEVPATVAEIRRELPRWGKDTQECGTTLCDELLRIQGKVQEFKRELDRLNPAEKGIRWVHRVTFPLRSKVQRWQEDMLRALRTFERTRGHAREARGEETNQMVREVRDSIRSIDLVNGSRDCH